LERTINNIILTGFWTLKNKNGIKKNGIFSGENGTRLWLKRFLEKKVFFVRVCVCVWKFFFGWFVGESI